MMKNNCHHLREFINSIDVNAKDATDDIPTIIMVMGDTIPASTAAWPNTKAPTIEIEELPLPGNLKSLSLSIWNIKLITNISNTVENGTPSFCIDKLINNPLGIASILNAISDIYIAGVNKASIPATILIILLIAILVDFS